MRPSRSFAIALVAALLASLVYFNICRHTGRLSQELVFDDVGYAVDAAQRFDYALDHGVYALALNLATDPPHSPYQTLLGMAGFLVGGVGEASIYAANGLILLVAAAVLAWYLRASAPALAVSLALVLTAPLAYFAINEFRPDIALGLAMALMAWWFLDGFTERRRPLFAAAGLALAAALMIKPTFFAHTIAIAGWLCALALAGSFPRRWRWLPGETGARGRETLASLMLFLGTGCILALPYAVTGGRVAFDHFWSNTRGSMGKFWSHGENLTLLQQAGFTFEDLQQLNPHVTVACVGATLFLSWILHRRGDRRDAARLLAFVSVAAVSVAIMFIGNHRSPFFYATAHWVAMFAAARGLAMACREVSVRARGVLVAVATLGLAFLFVLNSARSYWGKPSEGIRLGVASNTELVRAVWSDLQARGERRGAAARKPRVLVVAWGDVNGSSMEWSGLRLGQPVEGIGLSYYDDIDAAYERVRSADYVVLSNPLVANYRHDLPDGMIQPAVAARLFADRGFRLVSPAGVDRAYFLMANERRLADRPSRPVIRMSVVPIDVVGLGPQEGPYPERSVPLPALRWMRGPEAAVCFAGSAGHGQLELDYFSAEEARLTAMRDDVPLGDAQLAKGFGTARWPVALEDGRQCLRLRLRNGAVAAPGDSVFFTRLELRSAP